MNTHALPLLEVALNGSRDHAGAIHMHPYEALGRETLAAELCAAALKAHAEAMASRIHSIAY